jgi:hypothetical protein
MSYTTTRVARRAGDTIAEAATAGAVAGIVGGVLMITWLMSHSGAVGAGFWLPLRLVGATAFGIDALLGGVLVLAVGLFLHMVVSAAWGALFGLVEPRQVTLGTGIALGMLWGMAVLIVMTYLVLPFVNPIMVERVALMVGGWIAGHLIYGACLGLTAVFRRELRI